MLYPTDSIQVSGAKQVIESFFKKRGYRSFCIKMIKAEQKENESCPAPNCAATFNDSIMLCDVAFTIGSEEPELRIVKVCMVCGQATEIPPDNSDLQNQKLLFVMAQAQKPYN
jgi:hypothetical protein